MSTKPEKTQKTPTAKALPITTSCANDPATETPNPAVRKTPLDIKMLAGLAKMTHSLSPMSLSLAGIDWAGHLAFAPGKRLELFSLGLEQMQQLWQNALPRPTDAQQAPAAKPDRRFADPAWQQWPFNVTSQAFLNTETWWKSATQNLPGVSKHHEDVVSFMARQGVDMLSPGNYPLTNPVVLQKTMETGGANLQQGMLNFLDDLGRTSQGLPPAGTEDYVVGKNLAATPGKVVYRNRLIELIQYSPTTDKVQPEPVLIVPAWIMKYYILDLSAHNSLIKYMVSQGHTVFCISWKNPGVDERDLDMDDYLELGFHAALEAINAILPEQKVHATGYCLGGTLLAIAAAAMARDGDERLATMTLFTAQTDFTEPGELALFIDESEVSLLEAQMAETGFLTAGQMSGAFQILRSNDLLWSRIVGEYLMGERAPMSDLMAWNADATRMPARMHSQYLRRLFLNDDLSEGRYPVAGKPVSLSDIDVPVFCVATQTDHVAPWRSVYKLHYLTPTEITFVLTSGGHNAGIVSEPGHPRREYQIRTRPAGENYMPPDDWVRRSPQHEGSWWPAWSAWLAAHSGAPTQPPALGAPERGYAALEDAPGRYVHEK